MRTLQTYIVWLILLSGCFTVKAQSTPEAFLAQLPPVPNVDCLADTAEISRFSDKVDKVIAEIREVIERIHAEAQSNIAETQNYTGEEQMRKSVEKTVSEQYSVSMQELENVGEMSDADQEKWAQQYADRMKKEAQKNPTAAVRKGDKAKHLFELTQEQNTIFKRITERMDRVARLFKEVDRLDSIETIKLEAKIAPWAEQLCSGICTPAEVARSKVAERKIYELRLLHCQKMSPMQVDAILQYQTTLKALLPDYRKLTEVQNEAIRLQEMGEIVPKELSCYAAVNEYATELQSAYRYWIGKFEQ